MDSFLQDLITAVRTLRRRPGFAAAAVFILALAIGANAAMFGVIKTVVLAIVSCSCGTCGRVRRKAGRRSRLRRPISGTTRT